MKDRIECRIKCIREFLELLEIIGIDKEFGSGISQTYVNEINFLSDILKELP